VSVRVPVTDGLFSADGEPRLHGSRCLSCGGHHFPRHTTCPYCSSGDVDAADLSTTGSLWAWTAVTARPPGYNGPVPYGFGVVELPERIRVIALLTESDPSRLRAGQPMRLTTIELESTTDDDGATETVLSYGFEPT